MEQDERDRLERDMTLASSNLRKIVGGKAGEGVEKVYGQAYRSLVRAGLRQKLKRKYQ